MDALAGVGWIPAARFQFREEKLSHMTGAMYAAVAGLKTHMGAMNVIGNNIANVNTNAYKASSYTFKESLYTTSRGGSDGTDTQGGVNPAQIGYGCSIGSIDMDMSSKNYAPTGRALDICIDGDGFLMVGDKGMGPFTDGLASNGTTSSARSLDLVRLGRLKFDPKGYLTDDQGRCVYGFATATKGDNADGAAQGTPELQPNLTELRIPYVRTENKDGVVTKTICYPKVDESGRVIDNNSSEDADENVTYERALLDSIQISMTGVITGVTKDTDTPVVIGQIALGQVDNPEGLTHVDGRYFKALDGAGNLHITSMGGQITNHRDTEGAGGAADNANTTEIEHAGGTSTISGGLESSGTDLATEISNMIVMQRGYQANTRIITVTDSMLEELVNMKR